MRSGLYWHIRPETRLLSLIGKRLLALAGPRTESRGLKRN